MQHAHKDIYVVPELQKGELKIFGGTFQAEIRIVGFEFVKERL